MKSIETALGRLDGVKSAKVVEGKKTNYTVKIVEKKTIPTETLDKCLTDAGYSYEGCTIEIPGTVAKDGDAYVLTARGSEQKYSLKPNDDLRKLVADGKTTLVVTGDLTQPEPKDGKKQPPLIEVDSAKEIKVEKK